MVDMQSMLKAGVHFGHHTRYWNPKMAPYLFGARNKIHIINLEKTLPAFEEALGAIYKLAFEKETILFVGTKRTATKIVEEQAKRCGMPYVSRRWLGGTLTNYRVIRQSVNQLIAMQEEEESGQLEKVSKMEALLRQRRLDKLEMRVGGIKDMRGLPGALFIIDITQEKIAVAEARKLGLPVIAIVDSDSDPDLANYAVPGNDDSGQAIRLYTTLVADAILQGHADSADKKEHNVHDDASDRDGPG